MSSDERKNRIGDLILKRKDANEQIALLLEEIREWGRDLGTMQTFLTPYDLSASGRAVEVIDKLIPRGGLNHLRSAITDYLSLMNTVRDLSKTLKDAGAE
jgi:hypothetical protein